MSVLAPQTLRFAVLPRPRRLEISIRPFAAIAVASAIWGTSDVASKHALETFPPIMLSALRFVVALLILEGICRRKGIRPLQGKPVALLGIFGIALTFVTLNLGLRWTQASDASLIQGATPAIAVALAILFCRERPGRALFVGMFASFAGVLIIAMAGGAGLNLETGGNLLILASATCFSLFVVFGRSIFAGADSFAVLTGSVRYAVLLLVPVAAIEVIALPDVSIGSIGVGSVGIVLYLGACCSALSYALWGYALSRLESSRAAIFDNLTPIVGVVAGVTLMGDALTSRHLIGMALVCAGVVVVLCDPSKYDGNEPTRVVAANRIEQPEMAA